MWEEAKKEGAKILAPPSSTFRSEMRVYDEILVAFRKVPPACDRQRHQIILTGGISTLMRI